MDLKTQSSNEKKCRSIFEKSSDVIFLCKPDGTITQINQAGNILAGCQGEEIVGCKIFELIDSKEQALKLAEIIYYNSDITDEEIILFTKQNEKRFYLLSLSREEDFGQQEYLQGILHDITKRKQQENNTLQIQKLDAAGRLMLTLAHEVRNPLNNINLSAEQLIASTEEERALYIDIIQRNSKRINTLITELLHSLRSEINFGKVILKEIINEVLLIAEDSVRLKNISLSCSLPEENIFINADKEKLIIAILNLINNAIEAVEKNTGKITISFYKEGSKYILKVTDNGCGMNEEQISRLFEPYYTTKRNGMGLGMVATLSILQGHNATINVNSKINEGTVFTIEFENQQK
jgi:PAS domain S-box-containing protein